MFADLDWKKVLRDVLIVILSALVSGGAVSQLSPPPTVNVQIHTEKGEVHNVSIQK